MTMASMPCWTRWPTIWRRMWIWIVSSRLPDDRQCQNERKLQDAGAPVQVQGGADIGSGGVAAALAHEGIRDSFTGINARAGQLQIQCTGHGRFRPAGIGRAMFSCIAPNGLKSGIAM